MTQPIGPYGVRIDNLLSISRSFVGGGSVPRSESPDGAGSYRTAPQGPLFRAQSRKSVGPYGVRIDNLLSISRSFVGGGSVPRSESPDGAGSYRTAPQGPLFRAQSRKSVGPYGVRIDNLLSISRSFVGGGSVPRSESPDGAGSYRTAPQGPLFRAQSRKSVGPLRGAHRQFVVDLSVFCRRGLCPPLGIAGRSRLLQDCPAGATFPGAVPEKRRPLRGAHRQFVVDLSVSCRRGLCPPLGIAGRSRLLQDCPAGATFPGAVPEKRGPLRGAHRQFVVDLSVSCRRGLCPPLGIAGRSRLLQDCPAGATFPGAVPEKRGPLRGAHRQFVVDLSVSCRR